MTRLALIGTAGRQDDGRKLTRDHWVRMNRAVTTFLLHRQIDPTTLEVVSGGAAWSDHLAVALVLNGTISASQLTLYLPAALRKEGYCGDNEWAVKVAGTANYYHERFSAVTGEASIAQLHRVIADGSVAEIINGGFKARNSKVASFLSLSDELVAFTFGDPGSSQPGWSLRRFTPSTTPTEAGLKDGGTADTFQKAQCMKNHARIGDSA